MNETHGMRSQKFGVEIETKGLGLAEAARVIAGPLGGEARGTYVTDPETGKTWKAVPDGSLHGVSAEVVTPILTCDEIPKLQEVVRALRRAGARVDNECGLHVHVDASPHDAASLARLVKLINSKEKLLFKALQVNEARLRKYAQGVDQRFLNRIVRSTPHSLRQLNRAWYGRERRRPGHYDQTRYHALNLHAVWDKGTVEFRLFNGTLHAGKVKAYVHLCLALSHKALAGRAARHRPTLTTNDKFTFRVWLVGLGLKGKEFKTARKHLTADLSGSSAWRYNQGGPRRRRKPREQEVAPPATTESALNTIYLENRSENHFKFYRIEWNGRLAVRTTWGRIGTEGRSREERFEGDAAIEACVEATDVLNYGVCTGNHPVHFRISHPRRGSERQGKVLPLGRAPGDAARRTGSGRQGGGADRGVDKAREERGGALDWPGVLRKAWRSFKEAGFRESYYRGPNRAALEKAGHWLFGRGDKARA